MANGRPDRAPLRPLAGDMAKRHNGPPGRPPRHHPHRRRALRQHNRGDGRRRAPFSMAKPKRRCVTIGKRTTPARSRPATPSTIRPSITSSSGAPRTSSRRTPPSEIPTLSLSLNTSSSASPRTRRTWRRARRSGAMPTPPAPTSSGAANSSGSAAPTPSSTTNTPSGGVRPRR